MDRHCGNCKYFGEPTGKVHENEPFHRCNNDNSIFKACLFNATGRMKFEAGEDPDGND